MPTYSHSQLSTYETCPHQYKLSYIDKIKIETEGIEAFMGSRVHEALEKLYRDLKVTKLNTLEKILDDYRQDWEKNWNEEMVQKSSARITLPKITAVWERNAARNITNAIIHLIRVRH